MALVIASLTMVTLGILAVKRVVEANDEEKKMLRSRLLYSAAIVGGILIVFALLGGSMFNFSGASDAGLPDVLVKALRADRESMFIADVWRSFTFVAVAAALLYIYLVNRIKRKYMVLALALLFLFDLWSVDKRFLSYDDFMPKRETTEIRPTEADKLILQDKEPNYRVLNLARNTFNESYTSYFQA